MEMKKNKSVFTALFVMLLWGSLFPAVKLGYRAFDITGTGDILYFAGVRFTICGIAICIYAGLTDRKSYRAAFSCMLPILWSGVFAIILHYACTYSALRFTDTSKTAILKQVGTLFYVCFSSLFFKEDQLNAKKLIGVLIGFLGIVAINTSADGISFNVGDLLIICASFCAVISNIITKKVVFQTVSPIVSTGISQVFGGLVLLGIGTYMGGNMAFGLNSSIPIMTYICVASSLSYCMWYMVVKSGELSKLFIIKFAEPLFACLFGALILGENIFKIQYLIAFVLISGGIYISNKEK